MGPNITNKQGSLYRSKLFYFCALSFSNYHHNTQLNAVTKNLKLQIVILFDFVDSFFVGNPVGRFEAWFLPHIYYVNAFLNVKAHLSRTRNSERKKIKQTPYCRLWNLIFVGITVYIHLFSFKIHCKSCIFVLLLSIMIRLISYMN